MRRFTAFLLGIVILGSPLTAQSASLYDLYYDQGLATLPTAKPTDAVVTYVIKAMRRWNRVGVVLQPSDIDAAIQDLRSPLCSNKRDVNGKKLTLDMVGGVQSCNGIRSAILDLLGDEYSVQLLTDDLLAITSGNELALSDEPQRPGALGIMTLTSRRLLSGSGTQVTPWNPALKALLTGVQQAIQEDGDNPLLLERFHHGVFRDRFEADPVLQDHGDKTASALLALAAGLGITGDPKARTEYSIPDIDTENVAVWARGDDVGLMEKWPITFHRLHIEPAGAYPSLREGGDLLAYPFSYEGTLKPPVDAPYGSPLCQRSMGREGYLCRSLTQPVDCDASPSAGTGSIELTRCDVHEHTSPGPEICSGSFLLFKDKGQALSDIDPKADRADAKGICTPETKILYRDSLPAHACYVGQCIAQTLSGHSIMPGRNPVVALEATDPFLALQKPDPTLGQLFELHPTAAPLALPPYIGPDIVRALDRSFCETSGLFPHPLAGFCTYNDSRRRSSPRLQTSDQYSALQQEFAQLSQTQFTELALAAAIGQRFAVEQSIPVLRTVAQSFALVIQDIADLLNELKNASITKDACPWTGPLTVTPTP